MNNSPKILDLKIDCHGLTYTLAGNDRDASFTASSDSPAPATDIRAGGAAVTFNKGQVLRITKARLVGSGAPGLQAGVGNNAAALKVIQGIASGSSITKTVDSADVDLAFLEYGRWEDKDFRIEFLADGSSLGIGNGSEVTVDDFNVQEDYVGETVGFVIEATAELYIGS